VQEVQRGFGPLGGVLDGAEQAAKATRVLGSTNDTHPKPLTDIRYNLALGPPARNSCGSLTSAPLLSK